MTLTGTLGVIHNFGTGDGTHPPTSLVEGTDGGLYGLTLNDGAKGLGTVYLITPSGSFSVVQSFDRTSGDQSYVALTQHTSGIFYGDTVYGGSHGLGTFYSYDAGLAPFIGFVVGAGRVGRAVGILGQGFNGTTSVTFDGVPAAFNVQSDTYLTAIVPTGAATGPVTVVTPGSMLSSKDGFRVLP
jgi:uncharacterized repeat protein (TIGR03803 family)